METKVFLKSFAAGVALPRVGVETDVSCKSQPRWSGKSPKQRFIPTAGFQSVTFHTFFQIIKSFELYCIELTGWTICEPFWLRLHTACSSTSFTYMTYDQ